MPEQETRTSETSVVIQAPDNRIVLGGDKTISPQYIQAEQAIKDGIIPKSAVQAHPGKGGKLFEYIDHVWVTQQVRKFFDQLWGYREIPGSGKINADGSATAYSELTLYVPMADGTFHVRTFVACGVHDGQVGAMTESAKIASAHSRAFVRCVFRAFGLGDQFYQKVDAAKDPADVWSTLMEHLEKHKGDKQAFITMVKEAGTTREDLLDDDVFRWLYYEASRMCEKPKADIPEFMKGKNGNKPAEETPQPEPKPASVPEPISTVVETLPPAENTVENMAAPDETPIPVVVEPEPEPVVEPTYVPVEPHHVPGQTIVMEYDPDYVFTPDRAGWDKLLADKFPGYDLTVIKTAMRAQFPGGFNVQQIRDYYIYLVRQVNAGKLTQTEFKP